MPSSIYAAALALITLLAISLNKTFHHLPLKELKRQAREHQHPVDTLYRAAAYGSSLQALLFVVILLSAAGSFVILAGQLNSWVAFLLMVVLLWLGFLWLPSSRLTTISSHLATWFSPLLAWALRYTNRPLGVISRIIHDRYSLDVHTGIYDKADLVELLEWQKEQADSRIPPSDIEFAERALNFGGKTVHSVLVSAGNVKSISSSDRISPVLIDDLHKTGHSLFPVYEGKKDKIVGIIALKDLVAEAKSTKPISSIMQRNLHYIHEDFSLHKALQAFSKTRQHMLIVVNQFEELVGIITMNDVLQQMVGQFAKDEFDQYDDKTAVAAATAEESAEQTESEPTSEELPTEAEEAAEP